jgi:hypothetical protein
MKRMQSSKTPKKTSKISDKPAVAAVSEPGAPTESIAKPRAARSSKKKMESGEAQSAVKHHHKLTSPVVPESSSEMPAIAPKAFAAAAGASIVAPIADAPSRIVHQHEIAELAYSYWVARGYAPGSPEEDWLRAERTLNGR